MYLYNQSTCSAAFNKVEDKIKSANNSGRTKKGNRHRWGIRGGGWLDSFLDYAWFMLVITEGLRIGELESLKREGK